MPVVTKFSRLGSQALIGLESLLCSRSSCRQSRVLVVESIQLSCCLRVPHSKASTCKLARQASSRHAKMQLHRDGRVALSGVKAAAFPDQPVPSSQLQHIPVALRHEENVQECGLDTCCALHLQQPPLFPAVHTFRAFSSFASPTIVFLPVLGIH